MNRARITAMTIDSKYSRMVDFLKSRGIVSGAFRRSGSSRVAAFDCPRAAALLIVRSHLEHREERFLRDFDAADALHALLAFLLLFEQLALAGDVAAIAFREHVLAHRLHGLAGDDAAANRRLYRHLEHLTRNELAHLRRQGAPALVRGVAVDDDRQRINRI